MAGRTGLIVLVEPEVITVDIVFVHSLGGDRIKTWSTDPTKDNPEGVLWPRDLLPQVFPTARISSFGYDAPLDRFWSQHELGLDLFESLHHLQASTQPPYLPVIFVAHSFGGLFLGSALPAASKHHHHTRLARATKGIIFLGTPFALTYSSALKFERLWLLGAHEVPFGSLDFDRSLHTTWEFRSYLGGRPDLQVAYFYETKPTQGIGIIIDSSSAGSFEAGALPIAASHVQMSKFESTSDPGFQGVSGKLSEWTRALMSRVPDLSENSQEDASHSGNPLFKENPETKSGSSPSRSADSHLALTEGQMENIARTFHVVLHYHFRQENPDIHPLPLFSVTEAHRKAKWALLTHIQTYALAMQDCDPEAPMAKEVKEVSRTIGRLAPWVHDKFSGLIAESGSPYGGMSPWTGSPDADILAHLTTPTAFGVLVCNFAHIFRHYFYATMATIRDNVLQGLGPSPHVEISLDWDPRAFLQDQYEAGTGEKLTRVIAIIGKSCDAQMATVEQYISQTWPEYPVGQLMVALQSAVQSKDHSSFHRETFRAEGVECSIDARVNSGKTTVLVSGPESLIGTVAQQLAWLGAVCRTSSPEKGLAYCDTIWTKDPDSATCSFTVRFNIAPFSVEDDKSCWHDLLSNSVIATGFPIPWRPKNMVGLQIPLKIMAALGNLSIAINDGTGFVLSGDRFGFIPVNRDGYYVQWHLVRPDGDEMDLEDDVLKHKRLSGDDMDEVALHSTTAFLGWTPETHNYAGARSSQQTPPADPPSQSRRGIDYLSIRPSSGVDIPKTEVDVSNIQVSISKIVGVAATAAIGKKDQPYETPKTSRYVQSLEALRKMSVILYDTLTLVAWFIDAERLALQMALHWLEKQHQDSGEHSVSIDPVEHDAPKSLRSVMLLNHDTAMGTDYDIKDKKHVDCNFAEMVSRNQQIIRALSSKSASVRKRKYLVTRKICGWEYMDFINDKPFRTQSLAGFNNEQCGKWPDLAESLHSLILLGSNFQEILQPADVSTHCPSCRRVPQGKSFLAMEVTSLQTLIDDATPHNGPTRLSKSGITFNVSGNPLSPCDDCSAEVSCGKRYIQRLYEGESISNLDFKDSASGALVFGHDPNRLRKHPPQPTPSASALARKSSAAPIPSRSNPPSNSTHTNTSETRGREVPTSKATRSKVQPCSGKYEETGCRDVDGPTRAEEQIELVVRRQQKGKGRAD